MATHKSVPTETQSPLEIHIYNVHTYIQHIILLLDVYFQSSKLVWNTYIRVTVCTLMCECSENIYVFLLADTMIIQS